VLDNRHAEHQARHADSERDEVTELSAGQMTETTSPTTAETDAVAEAAVPPHAPSTPPPHCVVRFDSAPAAVKVPKLVWRVVVYAAIGGPVMLALLVVLTYLTLPLLTTFEVLRKGGARFQREDTDALRGVLRKALGFFGGLALVLDGLPLRKTANTVHIPPWLPRTPNVWSTLSRLVLSLPTAVALLICIALGSIAWLLAAIILFAWGSYPAILYRALVRSLTYAGHFACYQALLTSTFPRLALRHPPCVYEDHLPRFLPGKEARSFIKDWVTTLISTSGILVTLVLGVLALFHNSQDSYEHRFLMIDIPAIVGMGYFMVSILFGFRALGNLVSGTVRAQPLPSEPVQAYKERTMSRDKAAEHLEASRTFAGLALRMFLRGLTLTVLAAVGVVLVFATE
jgi:hypothetical protein